MWMSFLEWQLPLRATSAVNWMVSWTDTADKERELNPVSSKIGVLERGCCDKVDLCTVVELWRTTAEIGGSLAESGAIYDTERACAD